MFPSCPQIMQKDGVEIIANDIGNRTTPSWVAFTESERVIGDAAKSQAANNAANTIFDAKRLIGRKVADSPFSRCPFWLSMPSGQVSQALYTGKKIEFSPRPCHTPGK